MNHLVYYTSQSSGVECIEVTEHMSFCVGNAVKYLWRLGLKGDPVEDLKKARWYIDRDIKRLEAPPQADSSCCPDSRSWVDEGRVCRGLLSGRGSRVRILAVDPGPRLSAWVILDVETRLPAEFGLWENTTLRHVLRQRCWRGERQIGHLAIEMVASCGMPVGKDVLETAL